MSDSKVTTSPEPTVLPRSHSTEATTFVWKHYMDLARICSWPMGSDLVWYPSSKADTPCNFELTFSSLQCGDCS